MLLLELFNSKVDYKITKKTDSALHAEAMINGRKIIARYQHIGESGEFEFVSKAGASATHKLTGEGGELQVFSFIKDFIFDIVHEFKPEVLIASANKQENRVGVYEKFFKRLKMPGYHVGVMKTDGDHDIIKLVKDGAEKRYKERYGL